ncbi:hypothetical protein PR003_g27921, partial [Phytophthora rubi]
MAMPAVTVTRWATTGTSELQIAGDVLFDGSDSGMAPAICITPNRLPPPPTGSRQLSTMWKIGRTLITNNGGGELDKQHPSMIMALRVSAYDFGGVRITWEQDAYRVDGLGLLGSVYTLMGKQGAQRAEEQCLEWLPAAGLADLHVYHEGGDLKPLKQVVYGAAANSSISDVMMWTLEKRGILWVRPRKPKWRGDGKDCYWLGDLITVLVTNYPFLLTRMYDSSVVRITATPPDHPLTAGLEADGTMAVTSSTVRTECVVGINSHLALEDAIKTIAGQEVKVLREHPHPHLSRLVYLRTAGRRRQHSRKHYKRYVRWAAARRGITQEQMRAEKWRKSSATAAEGLAKLEWKQIRRILGLGSRGEQVLYRLKAWAYSMYDVRNGRLGCPHEHCAHEVNVDVHHIFWECPAARKLRKVFVAQWQRLGMPTADMERACFGLDLPAVPGQIWEVAAQHKLRLAIVDESLD